MKFAKELTQNNLVLFINSLCEPFSSDNIRIINGPITLHLLGRAQQKFDEELLDFGFSSLPINQHYDVKHVLKRDFNSSSVLLVEDNVNNQFVISQFLEKYNCKVMLAENGLEALELIEQVAFELILMDIHMPYMDGIEATRAIRGQAHYDSLPIVALTANALEGDREQFLEVGMNDYLLKPIKVELLVGILDKYLGINKQKRQKSENIEHANSWVTKLLNS